MKKDKRGLRSPWSTKNMSTHVFEQNPGHHPPSIMSGGQLSCLLHAQHRKMQSQLWYSPLPSRLQGSRREVSFLFQNPHRHLGCNCVTISPQDIGTAGEMTAVTSVTCGVCVSAGDPCWMQWAGCPCSLKSHIWKPTPPHLSNDAIKAKRLGQEDGETILASVLLL